MPIERIFLGVTDPLVKGAMRWWREHQEAQNLQSAEQADPVWVVPSESIRRDWTGALREDSAFSKAPRKRPAVILPDELPELLFSPSRAYVSEFLIPFLWADALTNLPLGKRKGWLAKDDRNGIGEQVRDDFQTGMWLADLHRDLSSAGMTFSDVAKASLARDHGQRDHWKDLAALEGIYRRGLEEVGVLDRQLARVDALRSGQCVYSGRIILVAVPELPWLHRRMLGSIAGSVYALCFAPEVWQTRYDLLGCLRPEEWTSWEASIKDSQWTVADQPSAGIRGLVGEIGRISDPNRRVAVASLDPRIVPLLRHGLASSGFSIANHLPTSIEQSSIVFFLRAMMEFLRARSFRSFAEFIRHPLAATWLRHRNFSASWLHELDQFAAAALPAYFGVADLPPAPDTCASIPRLNQLVEELFAEFTSDPVELPNWAGRVLRVLQRFLAPARDNDMALGGTEATAIESILGQLEALASDRPRLDQQVEGAIAYELILDAITELAPEISIAESRSSEIAIYSWAELPYVSGEARLVLGLNEEFVSLNLKPAHDLPEDVIEFVLSRSPAFQQAREKMILATLLESQALCHFVVLRTDHEGAPLKPARLLFNTTQEEDVLQKWRKYLSDDTVTAACQRDREKGEAKTALGGLVIPRPPVGPIDFQEIRVTAFRSYLECPYRFWLQHVQKLEVVDDTATELDPFSFGNLAHGVLEHFGHGPYKDESNAIRIFDVLRRLLEQHLQRLYGAGPSVEVLLQVEQLAERLRAFATSQAAFVRDGWRIRYIEQPSSKTVVNLPGLQPALRLRGRIDRIDVHEQSGKWRILDYKTSAAAKTPRKAHMKNGEWVDLQLPMYRHLARALGSPENVEFGYLNLPQNTAETGLALADWDDSEFMAADKKATEIVNQIRSGEFWPPKHLATWNHDVWDDICLVGVRAVYASSG